MPNPNQPKKNAPAAKTGASGDHAPKKSGDHAPKGSGDHAPKAIRRWNIGFQVAIQLALAVALFFLANWLSFRHYARKDLSAYQSYTLSQQSHKLIAGLDKPLTLTVAWVKQGTVFNDISALVEEYAAVGKEKVRTAFVDPARDPDQAEHVKSKYGVLFDTNMVIVDLGGSAKVVTENEMINIVRTQFSGKQGTVEFYGERAITSAVLALQETKPKKIYLMEGSGELRATAAGSAYDVLQEFAKSQNAVVGTLNLREEGKIPADASALVLINPQQDFTAEEAKVFNDYWEGQNGAILILLNPESRLERLGEFLTRNGITPQNDRVMYWQSTAVSEEPQPVYTVTGDFFPDMPITRPLQGRTAKLMRSTQSLRVDFLSDSLRARNVEVYPLIQPDAAYWGEVGLLDGKLGREDNRPPLYVAASVERGAVKDENLRLKSSRMVVAGNATLLDPDISVRENLDFIYNSLNWMLDRDELLAIPPKSKVISPLQIHPDQQTAIFRILALLLPGAMLGFGVFVWAVRRA